MVTPVERRYLANEVVRKLRTEILTGNITPGTRLLDQDISARMRTSRGPVRDALIQLEHEGLVRREPGRGATVVEMSIDDVEEVCSIRLALEQLAVKYAIERAGAEDLARLDEAVRRLRESLEHGYSLLDAVDLDLGFHEEYLKAAKHHRLLEMWRTIKPQIWFLIYSRKAYTKETFEEAIRAHADIVDAIRRKDHRQGAAVVKHTLGQGYKNLAAIYRSARPS